MTGVSGAETERSGPKLGWSVSGGRGAGTERWAEVRKIMFNAERQNIPLRSAHMLCERYSGLNVVNRQFYLPHSYFGWNLGCTLWSRSVMLGSAESEMVRLISREIIVAEFGHIWSRYLNIADERTDNLPRQYRATRSFPRYKAS